MGSRKERSNRKDARCADVAAQKMPWESANPKVISFVQVRMPETLSVKVKWVVYNSGGKSVHAELLRVLEKGVDDRIAEILQTQDGRTGGR